MPQIAKDTPPKRYRSCSTARQHFSAAHESDKVLPKYTTDYRTQYRVPPSNSANASLHVELDAPSKLSSTALNETPILELPHYRESVDSVTSTCKASDGCVAIN